MPSTLGQAEQQRGGTNMMPREIMATHGTQPIGAERFTPSEFIKEELADRGWDIEKFAEMAGLDVSVLRGVVEDDYVYQQGVAEGIGRAFGTSSALWMNLQLSSLLHWLHELWAEAQERGGGA